MHLPVSTWKFGCMCVEIILWDVYYILAVVTDTSHIYYYNIGNWTAFTDALGFRLLHIHFCRMAMRPFLSKLPESHPQEFKLLVNLSTVVSVIKNENSLWSFTYICNMLILIWNSSVFSQIFRKIAATILPANGLSRLSLYYYRPYCWSIDKLFKILSF
jgi:hypothetical protein